MKRLAAVLASVLLPALLLAGCTGDGDGSSAPSPSASSSATVSESPTPTPAARVPAPRERACYALGYDQALAPTSGAKSVPCAKPHTSMTYAVGVLDAVVDGHLLAVDSDRVQSQVATECPRRLPAYLGGSLDDLHLSMLRAVWFTPTVKLSDAGADWYRCDVIAVASEGRLAPLAPRMGGVLGTAEGRDRFGMCSTAEPGHADFFRVICSRPHSWRAVEVVHFAGARYPGPAAAREAGQAPCEDAGRAAAADPLQFTWGYEWPTKEKWDGGQHYGLCWVPD
ncbi:septum formation family protein [Nocardioides sp. MAHUQ-72]|uniref:septum formation family protein n=1 Tax=unclassified Nocardioides TaxID=2615069 RepID=UPI00360BF598